MELRMKKNLFMWGLVGGIVCAGMGSNLYGGEQHKSTVSRAQQRQIFHYLNANYPDEMREIKALLKTDPAKARKEIAALSHKGFAKLQKDKAEWEALINQYLKTKDSAVLSKIKAKMVANYDLRIKYRARAIKNIEAGLEQAKVDLKQFKANKNIAIAKALDKLRQQTKN